MRKVDLQVDGTTVAQIDLPTTIGLADSVGPEPPPSPAGPGVVDVLALGADPTCERDSSAAIQAAIEQASTRGIVNFPPGIYRLDEGVRVERNEQTWLAYGAELRANFMGAPVVTCGRLDATHQRIRIYGPRITRTGAPDWTAGSAGLVFLNTTYCAARDFSVVGFRVGLKVHGSNGLCQLYGRFEPHSIWSCLVPVEFSAASGGAVNENLLVGGSLKFIRTDPDASAGYVIRLAADGDSHQPNGVHVFGTSLETQPIEAGYPAGAIYCDGLDCSFIGLRYEGFTRPFITGPARARHNYFAASLGLTLDSVDLASMGTDNHVLAADAWHCGGNLRVAGRYV